MATPWQELEIEPTADVLAIRRAYRARLGRTPPEDAARLQAAYEGAIAALPLAAAPGPTPQTAGTEDITAALDRRDPIEAARLIAAARSADTLKLREDIELAERLLALLTEDPATPAATIREAASQAGWTDADGDVPAGGAFDRLRARLAADRWLEALTEASVRHGLFDSEATAARHLLGLERTLLERAVPPRAALAVLLSDFDRHRPWVAHRFDPAALAEARRLAGTPEPS
jgi:hypothetical protein